LAGSLLVALAAWQPGPVFASTAHRLAASTPYWHPEVYRAEGDLRHSLYASLAAVIPDRVLNQRERAYMAWEIADIFRWQADFTRDIRSGDHFRVVFERLESKDGEIRYGRLLAADLIIGGRTLRAFEFDDPEGHTAFYDGNGVSLRRSFLRVPVEFRRISSDFSAARFHPILQRWRKHEGIDYAAERGAPVMAVADGVVTRAATAGGYGKLVEIRHPNGVVTRYAHLARFATGVRPGTRVSQGQCIGFVGATGLATGPHLHYEFRIRGVATDPRILADEDGTPIPADIRPAFDQVVSELTNQLTPAAPLDLAHGGM
jgi:murein DD-endopeptidase MepM/ murein hydrolase activator NlpD